ncbi:CHAP domain-containing protein [Sphingobium algorifonticola]|uniref:CHAP domain-containing protein n=1 Tax=Sphingobium algorifonticola TaxID=2008318 RepID=A0A437JDM1_9SPHN|nr:CHAP domain-containing protein [Sphingobium algorifonticola]RVT43991.1 CHAP domain-containing protein [Sphingobium algorifonticola]
MLLATGLALASAMPLRAADILQCVPYARAVSGVVLYGDAWTWWDQAAGRYDRGHRPRKGAVLAFQPYGPMELGHVAVVSKILSAREVLIRHANWSSPGAIEEDVRAIDVSDANDWSEVRVWHTPTGQMGARTNPTFGFIYGEKARLNPFTGLGGYRLTQAIAPVREAASAPKAQTPRLAYADVSRIEDFRPKKERSLADIIRDVKRDARIR